MCFPPLKGNESSVLIYKYLHLIVSSLESVTVCRRSPREERGPPPLHASPWHHLLTGTEHHVSRQGDTSCSVPQFPLIWKGHSDVPELGCWRCGLGHRPHGGFRAHPGVGAARVMTEESAGLHLGLRKWASPTLSFEVPMVTAGQISCLKSLQEGRRREKQGASHLLAPGGLLLM